MPCPKQASDLPQLKRCTPLPVLIPYHEDRTLKKVSTNSLALDQNNPSPAS